MADIGSGIDSPAIEQDVGIAQIQAAQLGQQQASLVNLPAVGFVASINSLSGLLTLQAGTSSTGVTVTISSDGVSTISIGITGISTAATAKSNIAAFPPTAGNDESEGYSTFSIWLDSSLNNFYMCASNATAAAIWVLIG
jgi:hypothetical protein